MDRPLKHKRTTVVFLAVLAAALALAACSVLGREPLLQFGIVGAIGPLLLVLPAVRAQAPSSFTVLVAASVCFAAASVVALGLALLEPLAALGALMLLWFSWLPSGAIIALVTFLEGRNHA